ncbi:MAG: hypothetical protein R2712_31840 [Vicinamibacterales bacterium]
MAAAPESVTSSHPREGAYRGGVHPIIAPSTPAGEPTPSTRLRPSPDATSLTGRRRVRRAGRRARAGGCVSGRGRRRGRCLLPAAGLRRLLETALHGYLAQAAEQLNEAEDAGFRRAERDAADAERSARLAVVAQTADEARERDALLAEAARDAAREDTLEARLGRIERCSSSARTAGDNGRPAPHRPGRRAPARSSARAARLPRGGGRRPARRRAAGATDDELRARCGDVEMVDGFRRRMPGTASPPQPAAPVRAARFRVLAIDRELAALTDERARLAARC